MVVSAGKVTDVSLLHPSKQLPTAIDVNFESEADVNEVQE
jgi:hypothetical protein